jgi:ribosomal protein L37E
VRWGLAATALTAVMVYGTGALLGFDAGSSTVSFVMFGFLFGGTAAFLGTEVARYRRCPRCGHQQQAAAGNCPSCGYDVAGRPTYVCSEGHAPSYSPGLCDCGRRLQQWVPPDVSGHVKRSLWLGAAIFTALVIGGLLLDR